MYVCGIVSCHDPKDASWINYTKNQAEKEILTMRNTWFSFPGIHSYVSASKLLGDVGLHHNFVSHLRWHWLMGIITEYAWLETNIEVKIFNI